MAICFYILPDDIFDEKEISQSAKLLYALILRLTQQKGYCWASNDYLSEKI